jgi:cytoskeletal protein RodZ
MHEESSSCRGSTSGESRDSEDVLMLHTPEGSVGGGDHLDPAELELEQKKQQQRREEEDKEQQKQHADRLCPAPVVVVSKSPTSVAGLGWAGVLKMNLNAPPPAAAPAVDKAVTAPAKKMPKPISRPTPASAPVAPAPVATPVAVETAPAPTPATATATAHVVAPVAVPGKLSYAAMLGMAAKGPAADTATATATATVAVAK